MVIALLFLFPFFHFKIYIVLTTRVRLDYKPYIWYYGLEIGMVWLYILWSNIAELSWVYLKSGGARWSELPCTQLDSFLLIFFGQLLCRKEYLFVGYFSFVCFYLNLFLNLVSFLHFLLLHYTLFLQDGLNILFLSFWNRRVYVLSLNINKHDANASVKL